MTILHYHSAPIVGAIGTAWLGKASLTSGASVMHNLVAPHPKVHNPGVGQKIAAPRSRGNPLSPV